LWELGVLDGFWQRVPGAERYGRSAFGSLSAAAYGQAALPIGLLTAALAGLLGILLFVRLVSMLWAAVRLYGFTVTRVGDDLRTQFGLLTRVTATIPLHHVQTITVRDSVLHRCLGRSSVRVETAGSDVTGDRSGERKWLAPLIACDALPAFLRHVIPGVDIDALAWQPVHPRASARAVRRAVVGAVAISGFLGGAMGWWAVVTLPLTIGFAVVATRRQVARLAWVADADVVVFRSGWLWRHITVARVSKIQAVALHESLFDRRWSMASVRVDTAGANHAYRVDIPYLDSALARPLQAQLAALAAQTEFRW
jgi:putative membrane protein